MSDAVSPPYSPTWWVPPKAAYRPRGRRHRTCPALVPFSMTNRLPSHARAGAHGGCARARRLCCLAHDVSAPRRPDSPPCPHDRKVLLLAPAGTFFACPFLSRCPLRGDTGGPVALASDFVSRRPTVWCVIDPEYRAMIILCGIFAFSCNWQEVFCRLAIVSACVHRVPPAKGGASLPTPPDGAAVWDAVRQRRRTGVDGACSPLVFHGFRNDARLP